MPRCTIVGVLFASLTCATALQTHGESDHLSKTCPSGCKRLKQTDWSTKCGWWHCKKCPYCFNKTAEQGLDHSTVVDRSMEPPADFAAEEPRGSTTESSGVPAMEASAGLAAEEQHETAAETSAFAARVEPAVEPSTDMAAEEQHETAADTAFAAGVADQTVEPFADKAVEEQNKTAAEMSAHAEAMSGETATLAEIGYAAEDGNQHDATGRNWTLEESKPEVTSTVAPAASEVAEEECSSECYSGVYALAAWHDPTTGRGKCMWVQCKDCYECQGVNHIAKPSSNLAAEEPTQTAEEVPAVAEGSFGNTAAIAESGYAAVAALKDDAEMLTFIRRLLDATGRYSTSEDELAGLAHWFSGTEAIHSFATLQHDLDMKPWVVEKPIRAFDPQHVAASGGTALLTESGYQAVAAITDDAEMLTFIKRLLNATSRASTSDDELAGLAHWFSGTTATQSFASLQEELDSKPWITASNLSDYELSGSTALLTQSGYAAVALLADDAEMSIFIKRWLDASGRMMTSETKLAELAHKFSGFSPSRSFVGLQEELDRQEWVVRRPDRASNQSVVLSGTTAAFTESGYEAVAALRDDAEMLMYITRVLDAAGRRATSEDEIAGLAHWFSGIEATQNFAALRRELDTKPWVVGNAGGVPTIPRLALSASTVLLAEFGYDAVVALKDDAEMLTFIKRVLDANGKMSMSEDELAGFAHWFSGIEATQSFTALLNELDTKPWVVDKPVSHLQYAQASGSTAFLSESGYKAVASLKNDAEMMTFIKRVMDVNGKMAMSEEELAGLARWFSGTDGVQSFTALLDELDTKAWVVDKSLSVSTLQYAKLSGSTALLSESGYKAVAALKDDAEMLKFVTRLLDATGRMVTSQDELAGLVQWFSGTKASQSLAGLQEELDTKAWVVEKPVAASKLPSLPLSGKTAQLTASGYAAVVALRDDAQMLTFIKRLLGATGRRATSEDELAGFAHWFSGIISTQSFSSLLQELNAMPWVVYRGGAVSNVTPALNVTDIRLAANFEHVNNAPLVTNRAQEFLSADATHLRDCGANCSSEESTEEMVAQGEAKPTHEAPPDDWRAIRHGTKIQGVRTGNYTHGVSLTRRWNGTEAAVGSSARAADRPSSMPAWH